MPDQLEPVAALNGQAFQAEIERLNKIIQSLMNRSERNASIQGSDFNLFQTTITLENQVRQRTAELEAARQETEKITRALREKENNYRLLLENSPVSIHEIALDGRIISMSRAGFLMHGFKGEAEIQGSLYLDGVCAADRDRIGERLAQAYAGETSHFEFMASGPREQIWKSCFVPITNKNGCVEKIMGITEDITERKKAEELIRNFAFFDTLTQLPNRRMLKDRLHQAMAHSKRKRHYGAVMFLDLDNFKPLNDAHGHEVGDLLLIEVAQRITRSVREVDTVARFDVNTVARFGGDEFVIILSELSKDKELSIVQAGIVAKRIRDSLAKPYLLKCKQKGGGETTVEHHCTASIGVVPFINHEASQEDILKRADMAMYQAKERGRNTICFFEEVSWAGPQN